MILKFMKALLVTIAAGTPVWAQLQFVPVTPCRVVDTRNASGPFGGPTMTGNSARSFAVPQSACAIPATALAYSLNVTVVPEGPLSYLSLWPTGQSQPYVSTLNSPAGQVVANAAIVPAGTGGAVSVFVTDPTDVILDINGYFAASTSGAFSFYPAPPCRVADTRNATGTFGGPSMYAGQVRDFPIPLSLCDIPATAGAYSLNVTVVPAGGLGYLTTWPTGKAQPNASTLNSDTGKIVANAALVPAGTNESISVYVTNPTDVILDINGYFGQPGSQGALSFYPVTPCRVADTRNANGPFGGPEMGATTTRSFPVPASNCGIPATAAAYSLNVTVVPDGVLYYLSAWPFGSTQPLVSTLNSFDGSVVANAAIVPAGPGGGIDVYVTNQTQVILDINGYFAASGGSGGSAPNGYTITGMVSGLNSGASVVLLNNGANALTVSANGSFTFPTPLASGASYAVTVGTQPGGESCVVADGGPGVVSADVTNVVVTCTPTAPPVSSVAERALAQTGLSIALASNVLQSQLYVILEGGTQSAPCYAFSAGGSVQSGATPTVTVQGHPMYPVTVYYDDVCAQPYLLADITGATQTGEGSGVLTETATYYGPNGTTIGTLTLNVTLVETLSGSGLGGASMWGLGTFIPASGLHTPVQLGLACTITSFSGAQNVPCTGAVSQDFPTLDLAIGSVTSILITINADASGNTTNVTFTGGGSSVTGPIGGLTLTNPTSSSFVIQGGTAFGSTTGSGGSAAFALFPPTPTSWTLTDAAHDQQLVISVIDNTSRNSSITITQTSSGTTLATGTVDPSGTGTIHYSDGSTAAITSWTLAD
jgi:hypothetical protein